MSWLETLEGMPATVGGVSTIIERISVMTGRRRKFNRYPGRKGVGVRDLGEDAAELSITLLCIGDDCIAERNALEAALNVPGSVIIRTGHRGELEVAVDGKVRADEAEGDGSEARVSFRCVQLDQSRPQQVVPSVTGQVPSAADVVTEQASADFAAAWTGELPQTVLDEAAGYVQSAASAVSSFESNLTGQLGGLDGLGASVEQLSSSAASLVSAPGDMANQIVDAVAAGFRAIREIEDAVLGLPDALIGAAKVLMDFALDVDPDPATPARQAADANRRALERLVHAVTFAELAHSAVVVPYTSRDEAIVMRDELLEHSDHVSAAASADLYEAVQEMRRLTGVHLGAAASSLPEIVTYEPLADLPAMVLAHDIYGDATRADEIVERNSIEHPGFCGFGPLEVLRG